MININSILRSSKAPELRTSMSKGRRLQKETAFSSNDWKYFQLTESLKEQRLLLAEKAAEEWLAGLRNRMQQYTIFTAARVQTTGATFLRRRLPETKLLPASTDSFSGLAFWAFPVASFSLYDVAVAQALKLAPNNYP